MDSSTQMILGHRDIKLKEEKNCLVAQQKQNKFHVLEEKQRTTAADWVTKPQIHRNIQTQEIIEEYRQNLTKGIQSQLVKEASRIALCMEKQYQLMQLQLLERIVLQKRSKIVLQKMAKGS